MPDRYAVIGNPVAHSKSPLIHAEFARQTAQDLEYGAILAAPEEFELEVQRFLRSGGRGLNVTLPFKHRAFALGARRTRRADQALAVNTLSFEDGAILGDNTDGIGLVRDLTSNLRYSVRDARVLLMGAGGASYGVCGPLLERFPAELSVVNRATEKAVALRDHFRTCHPHGGLVSALGYPELAGKGFDLIINATSAGLTGAMPDVPPSIFAPDALAYDMTYGRTTPFMEFACAHGAAVVDGTGMLVEQAAESFHVWRGVRPDTEPVIALLRASTA